MAQAERDQPLRICAPRKSHNDVTPYNSNQRFPSGGVQGGEGGWMASGSVGDKRRVCDMNSIAEGKGRCHHLGWGANVGKGHKEGRF